MDRFNYRVGRVSCRRKERPQRFALHDRAKVVFAAPDPDPRCIIGLRHRLVPFKEQGLAKLQRTMLAS